MLTEEQHEALSGMSERLAEWDREGEGKFSALDLAVAARLVLRAFSEDWTALEEED